jgi:isochorismate synthase
MKADRSMQDKSITAKEKISERELFQYALVHAADEGYGVALWRMPNETSKNILLSFSPDVIKSDNTLEDLQPGFMMAPFDNNAKRYFLTADVLLSFEDARLQEGKCNPSSLAWLQNLPENISEIARRISYHTIDTTSSQNKIEFDFGKTVVEGVRQIEKGVFEKVVPSRIKLVGLPNGFDPTEAFSKLCASYPNAMISLVSIPGVGTWLGASPELLVGVSDQSGFRTVAVAGTKEYVDGIDPRDVAWTQKEIEEQALVCRYIINCFKKIRLREFEEHGPKTVVAGNLMHLKTEYSVDMKATNFPQLGSVMLQLLHPTSAVCGMPMKSALQFINDHESHDRAFYSGYIGPVNINNSINLFVNLRCLQLLTAHAVCYAGAGVTIDSDSIKEWDETEMKLSTLLSVIF